MPLEPINPALGDTYQQAQLDQWATTAASGFGGKIPRGHRASHGHKPKTPHPRKTGAHHRHRKVATTKDYPTITVVNPDGTTTTINEVVTTVYYDDGSHKARTRVLHRTRHLKSTAGSPPSSGHRARQSSNTTHTGHTSGHPGSKHSSGVKHKSSSASGAGWPKKSAGGHRRSSHRKGSGSRTHPAGGVEPLLGNAQTGYYYASDYPGTGAPGPGSVAFRTATGNPTYGRPAQYVGGSEAKGLESPYGGAVGGISGPRSSFGQPVTVVNPKTVGPVLRHSSIHQIPSQTGELTAAQAAKGHGKSAGAGHIKKPKKPPLGHSGGIFKPPSVPHLSSQTPHRHGHAGRGHPHQHHDPGVHPRPVVHHAHGSLHRHGY